MLRRLAAPLADRVLAHTSGWADVAGARFRLLYPYSGFQPGAEAAMLEAFTNAMEPGLLVFDIGANAGIFTLLAARAGARVIAFEPSTGAARLTRKHLAMNGLEDAAEVIGAVVTDSPGGTITFYEQGTANTSSISEASARTGIGLTRGDVAAVTKPTTTLDAAAARYGEPDVVKLDVEGAELLALRGAKEWLARRRGVLLVEVHPWSLAQLSATANDVLDLLRDAGWQAALLEDNGNTRHYVVRPSS